MVGARDYFLTATVDQIRGPAVVAVAVTVPVAPATAATDTAKSYRFVPDDDRCEITTDCPAGHVNPPAAAAAPLMYACRTTMSFTAVVVTDGVTTVVAEVVDDDADDASTAVALRTAMMYARFSETRATATAQSESAPDRTAP